VVTTRARTAASRAGFVEEGRVCEAAHLLGERVDDIAHGLLRSEWRPLDGPGRLAGPPAQSVSP
jgi:RimJ/RimL family protein N-acetyltransferase